MIELNNENAQNGQAASFVSNIELPLEIRGQINTKAAELKAANNLKKVFVVIVQGEESDDKPYYIAYLRRPNLMHFSQYMNFVQKDIVQANKMLASNIFLAGDKELVDDDDLFLYGMMGQLNTIIDSRNSDLVKR